MGIKTSLKRGVQEHGRGLSVEKNRKVVRLTKLVSDHEGLATSPAGVVRGGGPPLAISNSVRGRGGCGGAAHGDE